MTKQAKAFKSPPKRFQPKGLTIVYEDHDIIVVDKMAGIATHSNDKSQSNNVLAKLTEYVKRGIAKSKSRVYLVHHLDKEASGILLCAKNEDAKRHFQEKAENYKKRYIAVVHGQLEEPEGRFEDFLAENSIHKMYVAAGDGENTVKAEADYKVLQHAQNYSLVQVDLITDVKHQIRVQLASREHAVLVDKIYGEKGEELRRLGLHSAEMTIVHPYTKAEMTFSSKVPGHFYALSSVNAKPATEKPASAKLAGKAVVKSSTKSATKKTAPKAKKKSAKTLEKKKK